MVRVMEQQRKAAAARLQPANGGNQLRVIPFVNDDEVRARRLSRAVNPPTP